MGRLVSICIGSVPEAAVYVRGQARAAKTVGIPFEEVQWPSDISQAEAKVRIVAMNDDRDVLGNGVVGWVPRTAAVSLRRVRYALEADLSQRLLTLREDGRIVFRRRVSIGAGPSPTPSGRFHVSDQISGTRWRLGCCIVVLSGTQPRLPAGWNGGDRLAIHGRASSSESIGAPTSAGCLHATEATLLELARLPLGTPVVIHP